MVLLNISVPCGSHRDCAFHKPGAAKLNDSTICHTTYEGARETDQSPKELNGHAELSRLERLPQELFLIIVANLDPGDRVCLALASNSLTYAVGPDFGTTLNDWRPIGLNRFLGVLVRDLTEEYWHCEQCAVLHRRSTTKEIAKSSLLGRIKGLGIRLWPWRQALEGRDFHIRVQGLPIYTISFATAQAVMDRHCLGTSQGRCINTLKCSGLYKYPHVNELVVVVLKYKVEPKIVLDQLLLRATYTWEVENWKERSTMPSGHPRVGMPRIDRELLIRNLHLFVCEHMDAITALRAASYRPLTREPLRCQYCPTQFWVKYTTVREYSTEFQVWHNLGSCRDLGEMRWAHMVISKDKWNKYEWQKWRKGTKEYADEDVREAYEWVPYQTVSLYEERHDKVGHRPWEHSFYPGDRVTPNGRTMLRRSVAETILL